MTPAATAAGRAATKRQAPQGVSSRPPSRSAPPSVPAPTGARRVSAPSSTAKLTPRIPRRISGPAGGIDAAVRTPRTADGIDAGLRMPRAATGNGATIRFPRIGLGAPLRLARRRRRGHRPPRERRRTLRPIAVKRLLVGTVALVRTAPDHRWLDRLVRSRWWIPVLGVMLTAIVAMQVEVLKYGAGTGRAINLATRLESRNQLLSASVASLDSPQRIEQAAAQLGMLMAGPTSVRFVRAFAPGSVQEAISHIESPSSQRFMSALATAGGTGTVPAISGSTASAPTSATPTPTPTPTDLAAAATAAVSAGAPATTGTAAPAGTTSDATSGTPTGD